jgi:hypothetical protein
MLNWSQIVAMGIHNVPARSTKGGSGKDKGNDWSHYGILNERVAAQTNIEIERKTQGIMFRFPFGTTADPHPANFRGCIQYSIGRNA